MRRPNTKPPRRDRRGNLQRHHLGPDIEAGTVVDFFRSHLKQVVSIHRVMFEKLLFEEDSAVGPELAELFEEAGKTYLQIAERISDRCHARQPIQD
jgi:hypothetical protein